MNRLNNTVTYSIAVFAFLYSGTVVYCPFYMSGSAVINYAVTSAVCLIYSYAAAKYFSSRSFLKPKVSGRTFFGNAKRLRVRSGLGACGGVRKNSRRLCGKLRKGVYGFQCGGGNTFSRRVCRKQRKNLRKRTGAIGVLALCWI